MMEDVLGQEVAVGDVLALSARHGRHDSLIKVFVVTAIEETVNPDLGTRAWVLQGYDGAGQRTQIQKQSNLIVISRLLTPDHPRLALLRAKLTEDEVRSLNRRLGAG